MTLEAYDPAKLDRLSLRLIDVVARIRRIAEISRDRELEKVVLHDHKPLEWIARLEQWAEQSTRRVERAAQMPSRRKP